MNQKQPLWAPSRERVEASAIHKFIGFVMDRGAPALAGYDELHAWSVAEPTAFWDAIWDFCGVVGEKGARLIENGDAMPGAEFFPDAKLNFAENLLRRTGDGDALVFRCEDKVEKRLSWDDLHALVSRMQQALKAAGVGVGDRVAAMMPNMPETIAAMLATVSLGGIWSSCSPDFGPQGVLDRFGQIEPKVFIACDGYWYAGKRIEIAEKLGEIVPKLESASTVVIVPYLDVAKEVAAGLRKSNPGAVALDDLIAPYEAGPITYERLSPTHPLYILFSSGTTGIPKCIVHCAGGVLLQHLKEHSLNCDLNPGDRLFYFTTCGWMMWNWLVTGLARELTLLLFDGSPFAPTPTVLFDYAQDERMTMFGTSAKYIDALRKEGLKPGETHDLSSLRVMTSTGSPLAPESFDFVYADIKSDIHLASISGGTDIAACFVIGVPTKPVWKGEIQGPGLGMAVDVWDDEGRPVRGEKGELVCTKPFPSMPVKFWNDPDGRKYHAAYFERFDNVWCHGDFAEWTEHGGMIIHGRSDATLNPGGVRIGTAEIYNQVEQMPEVIESLAIGQSWDSDVRVVLFVRLADGVELDEALEKSIKARIRTGASPRHVPARIVAVDDIPRTKSGKITELAVRDVVHGREVKNKEALANPEALDLYRDLPQLTG
ncbi:acetoacetate--CoA ligase [Breoghania sp.]|uniref:acetoacetate--CoA ligase n=1 Tax=Breoghania sp. TaxID=2065378 RepID=UPI002AA67E2A|nr:acetoacetate--CoA ligase [Breoghania sp.]